MFTTCDTAELVRQIGRANIMSICGTPSQITHRETGITMKVGRGYRVTVDLAADDTYTVRRVFVRGLKEWVKGEETRVHCDQVGDSAYRASCFVNLPFGEAADTRRPAPRVERIEELPTIATDGGAVIATQRRVVVDMADKRTERAAADMLPIPTEDTASDDRAAAAAEWFAGSREDARALAAALRGDRAPLEPQEMTLSDLAAGAEEAAARCGDRSLATELKSAAARARSMEGAMASAFESVGVDFEGKPMTLSAASSRFEELGATASAETAPIPAPETAHKPERPRPSRDRRAPAAHLERKARAKVRAARR